MQSSGGAAQQMTDEQLPQPAGKRASLTTFTLKAVMAAASLVIFIGSTILLIGAITEMARAIIGELLKFPEISAEHLRLSMIESVDIVLVCTVLYIIAVGLYELFVDEGLRERLPSWLVTHDISDLEGRLTSMVVSVVAVIFLTQVFSWQGDDFVGFGLAIAAVIAAISLFLYVEKRNHGRHAHTAHHKVSGSANAALEEHHE